MPAPQRPLEEEINQWLGAAWSGRPEHERKQLALEHAALSLSRIAEALAEIPAIMKKQQKA
jgi:hypothetical protein